MDALDWTKWSAFAEIVNAIVILATLLYLAIQARQNTQAIRASSQQGLLERQTEFLNMGVADPETLLLYEKPNLSPVEFAKLYSFTSVFVRGRESMYRQYTLGVIDKDSYERDEYVLVYLLKGTERAHRYWVNSERALSSDFVDRINARLENFEGRALPTGAALFELIFSPPRGGQ